MDKRKWTTNFSAAEEELLVELVRENKNVVENKKTDSVMWKEKEECWIKITKQFNSQGLLAARSLSQLQLKYKNLKKVVRKKSASIRYENIKTGGGKDQSQALSHTEQKLKNLIHLSVDGTPSEFDDDYRVDETDNVADDVLLQYNNNIIEDDRYIVTIMPDEIEDVQLLQSTSTAVTDQGNQNQLEQEAKSNGAAMKHDFSESVGQWGNVTPQHLKHRKSTPLRTTKKHSKSRTAEATNFILRKDKLVECQIKCLEQEFEINELKKKKWN